MVEVHLNDPGVQSAIIAAAGSIIAAVIASVCAAIIGHFIAGRKKLVAQLRSAVDDVHFLLMVEEEHCSLHKERTEESFKQRVRQRALDRGASWSGKFTPGRVRNIKVLSD